VTAPGSSPRKLLITSALVAMVPVLLGLVKRLLMPSYLAGQAQTPISWLNSGVSLLMVPGRFLSYHLAPPVNHHDTPLTQVTMYAATFAFYFVLTAAFLFTRRMQRMRHAPKDGGGESVELISRRVFLRRNLGNVTAGTIAVGAAGATGYAWLFEPRRLPITRLNIPMAGLPEELRGFRIVQLTDIHHGAWVPLPFVRRAVDAANALAPDLFVLTGDYVTGSHRYFRPVIEELARLRAPSGVVAVLGNHDWWEGADVARAEFGTVDIPLIDNSARYIDVNRRLVNVPPAQGLCIGGVGDLWEDQTNFEKALGAAGEAMPRILLAHNPDTAEREPLRSGKYRVDLMLSGHTHGGQIRLPFLGTPIVPSAFGQKYAQGMVQGPTCLVYISRGVGLSMLPLRLGVPPEITLIELSPAAAEASTT